MGAGSADAWKQKGLVGKPHGQMVTSPSLFSAAATNGSAMVRVLSVSTAERTLLKGFTGGVADLAFAHLNSNQLACLDEAGNLFVWRLAMDKDKIQYLVKIHLISVFV